MKKIVRINENELTHLIRESVKRILNEGKYSNHIPYTGKDHDAITKHNVRSWNIGRDHDPLLDRQTEKYISKETGIPLDMFDNTIQGRLKRNMPLHYGNKPTYTEENPERKHELNNEIAFGNRYGGVSDDDYDDLDEAVTRAIRKYLK